ncbi:hypothetical protein G6F56_005806 [Rhizopus delemar]|uniref:Uncharacterized protein n=1 Tax=Rhizopus stolonifer TaxID=4846 RepID=A0A367JD46_RHIST|nr:hypothetical protein G6F56_005806 [Rhizopus delemar]RCH87641.1 hypothetical protein CU098_010186 [Rhizopus stolonifer]
MNNETEINSSVNQIFDNIERCDHATTDKERMKWAQKANDIHQTATHHPMAFDEHGRMKLNSEEAKKCPILH